MLKRLSFTLAAILAVILGTILIACEAILHWRWTR